MHTYMYIYIYIYMYIYIINVPFALSLSTIYEEVLLTKMTKYVYIFKQF